MISMLHKAIFIISLATALAAFCPTYGADSLRIKARIPWGMIYDFEFYRDGVFIAPDRGGISYYTIDDTFNLSYRYTIHPGGSHLLSQFCISDSFLFALDGSIIHIPGTPVFFVYKVTESTYTYLASLEPSGTIWKEFDPIIYNDGNIFYQEYPGNYFRIDVTDPSVPRVTGELRNTADVCLAMMPYQDSLLITARQEGYAFIGNFRVIKSNAPDTLISVGVYGDRPSYTGDIVNIGSILFSAHGDGFIVYDISDLSTPREIFFYPTSWGRCLATVNNYIFMGDDDGWYVFRYLGPDSILFHEYKPNDKRVLRMRMRLEKEELWCFADEDISGELIVIDLSSYIGIKEETDRASEARHQVLGKCPNPFNSGSVIHYQLPASGYVSLKIYNVSGQLVRTLVDGHLPAGYHTIVWDGRDANGEDVTSGIYFVFLRTGDLAAARKITVLR